MQEFLSNLLTAVITAAVPVLTVAAINLIRKVAADKAAQTDNVLLQGYITEIANAVADAVAATSQTYVYALKEKGEFTKEAQAEAAKKALNACIASISPAAQAFIEKAYGDLTEYLMNKIEAEVRKQKLEAPATIALPAIESTTDTTAVAASTAAATAATIAQTAIQQMNAEAVTQQ